MTIVGKNELINILLAVYMENDKNNQKIYLFGSLKRKIVRLGVEVSLFCQVTSCPFTFVGISFLTFYFCEMFVGIVAVNPHETTTRSLGTPRGLKACCIC